MKLTLEIAGGLAPSLMARRYDLDSATLPPAQQHELDEIVRAALEEPHREPGAALRDARSYEVHVLSDDTDRTFVVYDGAVPPASRN